MTNGAAPERGAGVALRIAFAGTPEFAGAALRQLLESGHAPLLVLTQPDRPAGRGLKLQPSAVKRLALAHGLALAQPRGLRLDGRYADDAQTARAALLAARPDVLVVAAYGLILPQWVLALPPLGCINIHASLLPRWRGAAPVQRAIEAGDQRSGITLMQMDAGLDTGDILDLRALDIDATDTAASLSERLATLGARMLVESLPALAAGTLPRRPQPAQGATYARKIDKAEAAIDWRLGAAQIERRVRAFDPFPGAGFRLGDETLKLWRVAPLDLSPARGPPGTVLPCGEGRLCVACGDGALDLQVLQRPGGRRMTATQFLQSTRGALLSPGTTLPVG